MTLGVTNVPWDHLSGPQTYINDVNVTNEGRFRLLWGNCEGPRNARSQIFTKVKLVLQSNAGYYIVAQKYHKNTKTQCMLTIVRSAAPAAQPRLPP